MDPVTLGLIAAGVVAYAKKYKGRQRHEAALADWDRQSRPYGGCQGERIAIPPVVREAVAFMCDGERAYARYGDCSGSLQIDHRVPLSAGGYNYADNLYLVCKKHNTSKGGKLPRDYKPRR